jgi:hypothetical protein
VDDETNSTFEPGFVSIPERDAIGQFPKSYKKYRVIEPFAVYAQSEEQARQRWQFFLSVLERLAGNESHRHDLVTYVEPERFSDDANGPVFAFIDEFEDDSFPHGGMSSGYLPEWDWLAPENDKDWSAAKLAYRIFNGRLDEEDEETLREADDDFWF